MRRAIDESSSVAGVLFFARDAVLEAASLVRPEVDARDTVFPAAPPHHA
jgi:hypothetical protein